MTIPVVADSKKIAAGANGLRAKVKCLISSGKVTVSYKVGGTSCKATGLVYAVGGTAKASGGGSLRGEWISFTID